EEEEEELEGEMELEMEKEGFGGVEYVSDVEESEEEDLGDLEDWLGGESEEGDSASENDDEESDNEGTEPGSGADEELKKKRSLAGQKRKHGKDNMPRRKTKGPKLEIEYEDETEPPMREALLA
ncbi:MAG: hypothetical protein Q9222_006110, partial [Ikaeria aurantiellina]